MKQKLISKKYNINMYITYLKFIYIIKKTYHANNQKKKITNK